MYYTALHYTVMSCNVLHCTLLQSLTLNSFYGATLHFVALHILPSSLQIDPQNLETGKLMWSWKKFQPNQPACFLFTMLFALRLQQIISSLVPMCDYFQDRLPKQRRHQIFPGGQNTFENNRALRLVPCPQLGKKDWFCVWMHF